MDTAHPVFHSRLAIEIPAEAELYEKLKAYQWNASTELDWSRPIRNYSEASYAAVRQHFTRDDYDRLRAQQRAFTFTQLFLGEQAALALCAQLLNMVPEMETKFCLSGQIIDEARHVEAYARLLHEKFELAYPITPGLKTLLEQTISDRRWDMTYLGMQILIEGLALAAFQRIRDTAKNPLASAVNAYVMQDEARHVAFGRLALREYYPQLSEAERDEREEFVVEACYHMRDRFNQREVWETLGLPVEECIQATMQSDQMRQFRTRLFTRIVPTVKDIGLWGQRVQKAYGDMGVLDFASIDAEALLDNDNKVAEEFDARRR